MARTTSTERRTAIGSAAGAAAVTGIATEIEIEIGTVIRIRIGTGRALGGEREVVVVVGTVAVTADVTVDRRMRDRILVLAFLKYVNLLPPKHPNFLIYQA